MKEYKGAQKDQPTKTPHLKQGGPTKLNVTNGIIIKSLRNQSPKGNVKSNQKPNLTFAPFPTT